MKVLCLPSCLSDEHITILMMPVCYVGCPEGLAAVQPMFLYTIKIPYNYYIVENFRLPILIWSNIMYYSANKTIHPLYLILKTDIIAPLVIIHPVDADAYPYFLHLPRLYL